MVTSLKCLSAYVFWGTVYICGWEHLYVNEYRGHWTALDVVPWVSSTSPFWSRVSHLIGTHQVGSASWLVSPGDPS